MEIKKKWKEKEGERQKGGSEYANINAECVFYGWLTREVCPGVSASAKHYIAHYTAVSVPGEKKEASERKRRRRERGKKEGRSSYSMIRLTDLVRRCRRTTYSAAAFTRRGGREFFLGISQKRYSPSAM